MKNSFVEQKSLCDNMPMKLRKYLANKIYVICYTFFILGSIRQLFFPKTLPYLYYHIMGSFGHPFSIAYYLAISRAFVDLLSLIPLYVFMKKNYFLKPWVWQWLFAIRLLLTVSGHSFQYNFLKSNMYGNSQIGILLIIFIFSVNFPSYEIAFNYAFLRPRQKQPLP